MRDSIPVPRGSALAHSISTLKGFEAVFAVSCVCSLVGKGIHLHSKVYSEVVRKVNLRPRFWSCCPRSIALVFCCKSNQPPVTTDINSCYYSWTRRQNFFCLQLHANERGQYNGKWPISLACVSRPLVTVITAILQYSSVTWKLSEASWLPYASMPERNKDSTWLWRSS